MASQNANIWYIISNEIIITLDILTNDILDRVEPIDEKYKNMRWQITGSNVNLDINKLIDKLTHCISLELDTDSLIVPKLPQNLLLLNDKNASDDKTKQNIILEFPNSLEYYTCNNCNIPDNLPLSLRIMKIYSKNINKTINCIPQNVTELYIIVENIEIDNILWPLNLKTLLLNITGKCTISIGILPYGLKIFNFTCYNYDYEFILPPTLIDFKFSSNEKYKYLDSLKISTSKIKYLDIPK